METIGSPALWAGFSTLVLGMLALDLGVFHKKSHEVGFREALGWSVVWVALSALFGVAIWQMSGPQPALEFTTAYLVEKALAVDNIFVFVVLFTFFGVPAAYQHRVLFWGIIGALVMRGVFIGIGAALLHQFHWLMYVFGGLLLFTAVKLFFSKEEHHDPEASPVYRLFRRFVPSTSEYRGDAFVVKEAGKWVATPLLAVLVLVEASDLLFAVDSIPAVFAVTKDPFIVYTSNIFAILGLRSMYFLLADVVHRFHYLKPALSLVLGFVGVKMLVSGVYKVPVGVSLGVIATVLTTSVVLSLVWPKAEAKALPQRVEA
jgi:tellurite resistance protein TerC